MDLELSTQIRVEIVENPLRMLRLANLAAYRATLRTARAQIEVEISAIENEIAVVSHA